MGLFSKLFGSSEPESKAPSVPNGASTREIIEIAVQAVIQEAGGNCATLESPTDSDKWIQIMDTTINCHYPHGESPETRFPELLGRPIVAALDSFESELFMTVSLQGMDPSKIADWIIDYFSAVLAIDTDKYRLRLRMEKL
ncbi:MAG: hypothetical protein AAGI48_06745 [Verrucomicrobiota bacterium]